MISDILYRAITELDFKIKEDKRDSQSCKCCLEPQLEPYYHNASCDDKEIEHSITMAFLYGTAIGFGSKYDEKDNILKAIREMIDEKEK